MKSLKELLGVGEIKPEFQIYCDMDGVLTNFDTRFEHFTGKLPKEWEKEKQEKYGEEKGTELFWELIDQKIGLEFWSEMEWSPQGERLWEFISPYGVELLTSPSKHETSRLGKNMWVKNNLKPQPKVNFKFSKEKHAFAHPKAIHIDDRKDIIKRWNKAGGIGIYHPKNATNIDDVINRLRQLGYG